MSWGARRTAQSFAGQRSPGHKSEAMIDRELYHGKGRFA
jgi:hypothetical protein